MSIPFIPSTQKDDSHLQNERNYIETNARKSPPSQMHLPLTLWIL